MISKTKEAIEEVESTLPENYQKVLTSFSWEKISAEIGEKYLLTGNDLNDLQVEIALVLLGLEEPEDFESRVQDNVVVSEKEAKEIEQEVSNKIFKPIDKLIGDSLSDTDDHKEELFEINSNKDIKVNPRFSTLPENLQGAISKSNYQAKVYEFGKKYGLTVEQMGVLEEIITKIILGEIKTSQFENKLSEKLTLPKEKLDELIKDTNKDIFEDIRHILESNWEENKNKQQNNQKIGTPIPVPIPPYAKKEEPPVPKTLPILNKEDGEETKRNIIEEKLNTHTKSSNSISDYSLPKINSNKNYSGKDPYREEI